MNGPICSFEGPYRFLSNFYPVEIESFGDLFPTVEHAFQAYKTTDTLERLEILRAPTPGIAKRLGRQVTLRPDWDQLKLIVMENLVWQKFEFRGDLRDKLLATGSLKLIEGNHWNDTYWGVCRGKGENHLGRILMRVRASLAKENA